MQVDKRSLGAYYSPEPYARVLVRWALAGVPGKVLDPSYGGCSMLRVALEELRHLGAPHPAQLIFGADIDAATAQWAAHLASEGVPPENLVEADFLSLSPVADLPLATAVVGNPPYVRHHRLSSALRSQAFVASDSAGVHLSARASLWAYFVIHATRFVAPGGRMALLLPGAVLQADYAPAVRNYLEHSFRDVLLVRVRDRIFDDAQEETVALLASGAFASDSPNPCRFADVDGLQDLERFLEAQPSIQRPAVNDLDGIAEWKLDALPTTAIKLLTEILAHPLVHSISSIGKVSLGTVTGANHVFVLTQHDTDRLRVRDLTIPVVGHSAWLDGPLLTMESLGQRSTGRPNRLLTIPRSYSMDWRTRLGRHLSTAEAAKVNLRSQCRRDPWWALPTVRIPSAFLPYTMGHPRGLAINHARAASTNTVHQLTWTTIPDEIQERSWALSSWSAVGRIFMELYGRHYGGGVLKLELSAAQRLPVIEGLLISETEWNSCRHNADLARSAADRALIHSHVGLNTRAISALHGAADLLTAQRVGTRARRPSTQNATTPDSGSPQSGPLGRKEQILLRPPSFPHNPRRTGTGRDSF